jgi:hypothetical protein
VLHHKCATDLKLLIYTEDKLRSGVFYPYLPFPSLGEEPESRPDDNGSLPTLGRAREGSNSGFPSDLSIVNESYFCLLTDFLRSDTIDVAHLQIIVLIYYLLCAKTSTVPTYCVQGELYALIECIRLLQP